MKRQSLPNMFVIASVLSDADAEVNLEPPTQLDPMMPSVMQAQLQARLAARAKTTTKIPVISKLPARADKASTPKRRGIAWIPGVVAVGIAIGSVVGAFRNDAHATASDVVVTPPAAQTVAAAPVPLDQAPTTPGAVVAPPSADNEVIDIPVSVPSVSRAPVFTGHATQPGMITPRVDPKGNAVASVPQPSAPGAKPTTAPTDAPTKAKGDADFEAALRAAQRANAQLDQTLR